MPYYCSSHFRLASRAPPLLCAIFSSSKVFSFFIMGSIMGMVFVRCLEVACIGRVLEFHCTVIECMFYLTLSYNRVQVITRLTGFVAEIFVLFYCFHSPVLQSPPTLECCTSVYSRCAVCSFWLLGRYSISDGSSKPRN